MNYSVLDTLSWRKLGDHTIILDTITNKKVHHLNEVGGLIWEEITSGKSKKEIQNHITQNFNCEPTQAANDLDLFIDELTARRLITIQD